MSISRREALGATGIAGLGLAGLSGGHPRVEIWIPVPCPRCKRTVNFLQGQRVNTCAWCGRKVTRGVE